MISILKGCRIYAALLNGAMAEHVMGLAQEDVVAIVIYLKSLSGEAAF